MYLLVVGNERILQVATVFSDPSVIAVICSNIPTLVSSRIADLPASIKHKQIQFHFFQIIHGCKWISDITSIWNSSRVLNLTCKKLISLSLFISQHLHKTPPLIFHHSSDELSYVPIALSPPVRHVACNRPSGTVHCCPPWPLYPPTWDDHQPRREN